MARKGKGLALYELLYKDKGKNVAADGSLKLPSWWSTDKAAQHRAETESRLAEMGRPLIASEAPGQATAPAPTQAPAGPEPAAAPAPSSAPAPTPAPAPAQAGVLPAVRIPVAVPKPSRLSPTGASPTDPFSRPSAGPGRSAPPGEQGPPGRPRIELNRFVVFVAASVLVIVLLVAFVCGIAVSGRNKTAQPPDVAAPDNDIAKLPTAEQPRQPDPRTQNSDRANANASAGRPVQMSNLPPGPDAVDGSKMIPGRTYVVVTTTASRDGAYEVKRLLTQRGFDVVVGTAATNNGNYHVVRSAKSWHVERWFKDPLKKSSAQKDAEDLTEKLDRAVAEISRQRPGLLYYKADDRRTHPYRFTPTREL